MVPVILHLDTFNAVRRLAECGYGPFEAMVAKRERSFKRKTGKYAGARQAYRDAFSYKGKEKP